MGDNIKIYVNPDWLKKNFEAFTENIRKTNHFYGVDVILANELMYVEDYVVIEEKSK